MPWSNAEYLAAFGVPMSEEGRKRIARRDLEIIKRWQWEIRPGLVLRPTFKQRLRALFTRCEVVAVPSHEGEREAGLERCAITTMGGMPLHLFKHTPDGWLYMGAAPSPGFPGS